eukprot:g24524.t1
MSKEEVVTRVGKSSMDLEHQVCHELPGAEGHKLLCSIASSIISLEAVVEQRRQRGLLRSLSTRQEQQVDFCSNDYLGFARSEELWQLVDAEIQELRSRSQQGAAKILLGSTGSRLLSGNSAYCEALEHDLAQFHRAESALDARIDWDRQFSIGREGVFYDELIHQSVREGFKLSRAKGNVRAFPHNDVRALEQMLAQSRAEKPKENELSEWLTVNVSRSPMRQANLIVAVESVYSMDGHLAPLEELCQVAAAWGASLIVDEAHGTGAYGEEGRGLVSALGLEAQVFCRVHTFGKALGVHGAVVVGPRVLREYLMNYAWPLVYSTSLPLHSLAAIRCAYAFMRQEASRRQDILRGLIQTFQSRLSRFSSQQVLDAWMFRIVAADQLDQWVWPTMITTAATIGAAGAGKAWPQALQCLDASLPHGQELLSSALFACEVAQRWTGALQIMEVISLRGHEPDMVRCSSVVSASVPLRAVQVLREMLRPWRRLARHQHRRYQVSLATALQQSENVLPCLNIVQMQIRPTTPGFKHSIKWSWNGKELTEEGTHRSKRGAKNEAARNLLRQLATSEAELLNPRQNGALAQWAPLAEETRPDRLIWLKLDVEDPAKKIISLARTMEDESPGSLRGIKFLGELDLGHAEARLHQLIYDWKLTELVQRPSTEPPAEPAEPSEPGTATEPSAKRSRARSSKASQERLRMGEINAMHNNVIQKLRIQASRDYKTTPTGIECKLTWRFYDSDNGLQTEEVTAVAPTKPRAKAMAHEQMLLQQNQMPKASEAETEEMQESSDSTRPSCLKQRWPSPIQQLGHLTDRWRRKPECALMHELLDTAQSHSSEGGFPVDLWESLLDEASFAVRHYFMALPALRQIAGFSLNDAFPGPQEKDRSNLGTATASGDLATASGEYFQRFRNLLALERHGGLMSGIQTYELDPKAACSVPTLEVHLCEADRIALSSPPESNILELVEGARPLRASDLVLLVPSEAAEEVRLNVRRISDFAADVELKEGGQRLSPITVGRNFKLFFLAMETPMDRQLTALRCLTRVKLPAWSENYESKPSYQYLDDVQKLLVAGPEEAVQKATAAARGGLTRELAENNLEMLGPACLQRLNSRELALNSGQQRLSLVQGPPGTGKTQVACAILAAWASIHAPMGEKILAVADSNVAADNIYVRLQRMGGLVANVAFEGLSGESMYREVQRAKILVATCIGSGMEVLTKTAGEFRRVLVDECTQACEPSVLVPLGRHCEQVVLIGDHAQLPATVLSKAAASDGLGLSLFERMAVTNGLEPSLLLEQRRMHSSIADFPNEMFYAGQLVNAADDVALEAVPGFPWPNPDCRVAFVDVASSSGLEGRRGFSAFNTAEVGFSAERVWSSQGAFCSRAQKLAWGIKDDDYMEPYKGDGYETSIPHHQNDHYDENYDHEASEEHKDYDDNWENYDYVHEASEENKDYDDSWENYDYVQEAPEEHKDYDDNWENYDYKGYEDTEEHDGYEDTMDDGFNQGPVSNIPAAFRNGSLTVPHFVHTRRVQADAEYQMKKEDMDQLGEWAEAVAETLERIINAGYPPNQIVVLTAYLAQKQELRRAIENRGLGQYLSSCHVDTIDGYQGMEQGLVLFSATRSNESNALGANTAVPERRTNPASWLALVVGSAGFLADNRRMNVMLTRAKQGLIVFGNAETLRNSASVESKWPAWLSWSLERNASVSNDQLSSLWQQATTRRPETQRQADVEPSKPTGAAPTPPPTPPTVWQQVYSAEHKAYYYWNQDRRSEVAMALTSSTAGARAGALMHQELDSSDIFGYLHGSVSNATPTSLRSTTGERGIDWSHQTFSSSSSPSGLLARVSRKRQKIEHEAAADGDCFVVSKKELLKKVLPKRGNSPPPTIASQFFERGRPERLENETWYRGLGTVEGIAALKEALARAELEAPALVWGAQLRGAPSSGNRQVPS